MRPAFAGFFCFLIASRAVRLQDQVHRLALLAQPCHDPGQVRLSGVRQAHEQQGVGVCLVPPRCSGASSLLCGLCSSLTTGLSNKADQSAFDVLEGVVATKSTPDGAMNGSIASANNATLATVAANYGLKTVVDQHSLDIAARITPLEVDTKVPTLSWGPSPPQRWPPSSRAETPPSRGCRPPRQTPAPSLLTPCSRPWTLPRRWTLR